ncbi:MAG: hypothetical protein KAJ49_05115 [Arcobacteraceae bacterium]|nr:hypothetical protein [Arcobacteraceae bacterium]
MAENNFPQLMKSFIVITLFAFLIVASVLLFAGNYNKDTTEISERIDLNAINSTLDRTQDTASGWQTTFSELGGGNIFSDILDILGLLTVGMFNLVIGMMSFINIPFALFGSILVGVLGVPVIVVNIINVLIILTIIFGIWSLVKRGV